MGLCDAPLSFWQTGCMLQVHCDRNVILSRFLQVRRVRNKGRNEENRREIRACWNPACRGVACHCFGTLTHSHTLLKFSQHCSVYMGKSYKSIWIPQQSSSNLFVWKLWWICKFQQIPTQALSTPICPCKRLSYFSTQLVRCHQSSNYVCVCVWMLCFISFNEWVVGCKAIYPSQTPNLSLSLQVLPVRLHTRIHTHTLTHAH